MDIYFDREENLFFDRVTGCYGSSKTYLKAYIKSRRLNLPVHDWLSNRFILEKLEG